MTSPYGARERVDPRALSWWALLLVGAASGLVGLLPWLITGCRLPLQNLWATETLPDDMPLALLPLSQYALTLIAGLLVTGSAVAGVAARFLRRRLPRRGALWALGGVLLVQLFAIVQSTIVVGGGLQRRAESTVYITAVTAAALVATAIGIATFWLIARAPRPGALLGLTAGSFAVSYWLSGVLAPIGHYPPQSVIALLGLVRWVPPLLVGAAIAWCGLRSLGSWIAAVASLLVLWLVPALATGISNAAGSRVLAHDLAEMLDNGVRVFRLALTTPDLALPPVVVAVLIAAIGLSARYLKGRIRGSSRLAGYDAD